ncbi:MAG: hypothetical protein JST01_14225 [Cyanobacteria bacterium SZAS TMP-1]|nr:hypothetical protein [Cyanobacteria bacterium SZAS TMP-1]
MSVLLDSKAKQTFDLKELNINGESVARHRQEMVEAEIAGTEPMWLSDNLGKPVYTPSSPAFVRSHSDLFTVERVAQKALGLIDCHNSTNHYRVLLKISLAGSKTIEASSLCEAPWMLPWRVSDGSESWDTFSLAVPQVVATLAPPAGPCQQYLNGAKYWRENFWRDKTIWSRFVDDALLEERVSRTLKSLPGYEDAAKSFAHFEAAPAFPWSDKGPYTLQIYSKQPAVLDSFVWTEADTIAGKKGLMWKTTLSDFSACSAVLEKQKWIGDWKKVSSDRTVVAEAIGKLSGDGFSENALAAWNHSGFAGQPRYKVALLVRKQLFCHILCSNMDSRSLVVAASGGAGSYWLDKQVVEPAFLSHDGRPAFLKYTYIVVEPGGGFQKQTVDLDNRPPAKPQELTKPLRRLPGA